MQNSKDHVGAPSRWPLEAWIPVITGFLWLYMGFTTGLTGVVLGLIPGCLVLSCGVSLLFFPGDIRANHLLALSATLAIIPALIAAVAVSPIMGLALALGSAASVLVAGWLSLYEALANHAAPRRSLGLAAQVAADDFLLGFIHIALPILVRDRPRIVSEIREARALAESQGWLKDPGSFHSTPPSVDDPTVRARRSRGLDYEHWSFESLYEPHPDMPGRSRWLAHTANRTAHAWVLRHAGAPRPWLICVHGYMMGDPRMDFDLFQARYLHRTLGLNLAFPILPLHGPRRDGLISGRGFLSGDVLDALHAEAQAVWDIRRLITRLRVEDGAPVAVYGLSLGAYTSALLCGLQDGIDVVVAGVVPVDFGRLIRRHAPTRAIRNVEQLGLDYVELSEVLGLISPLSFAPRVAWEGRHIFGASADHLISSDHVLDLWEHWERPELSWYPGAHVTFFLHSAVLRFVVHALRQRALLPATHREAVQQ